MRVGVIDCRKPIGTHVFLARLKIRYFTRFEIRDLFHFLVRMRDRCPMVPTAGDCAMQNNVTRSLTNFEARRIVQYPCVNHYASRLQNVRCSRLILPNGLQVSAKCSLGAKIDAEQ